MIRTDGSKGNNSLRAPNNEEVNAARTECDLCEREVTNATHNLTKHQDRSGRYVCHRCPRSFKRPHCLDRHIRNVCYLGRKFPSREPKLEEYLCAECGKKFSQKIVFTRHAFACKNERSFKCSVCGSGFNYRTNMARHMQIMHTDEKRYLCNICAKRFKTKKGLSQHEITHSAELPFKCVDCPRAFKEKWNYMQHRRIHTGDLPYPCTVCGLKFRYNVSMKTHRRTHEGR